MARFLAARTEDGRVADHFATLYMLWIFAGPRRAGRRFGRRDHAPESAPEERRVRGLGRSWSAAW
jgi:hypothetical protein